MTSRQKPARVLPPGATIRAELEARGWSQRELARILARPPRAISEIVNGRGTITPRIALELSAAFGTSARFWTNLEAAYRLHEQEREGEDDLRAVRERASALAA